MQPWVLIATAVILAASAWISFHHRRKATIARAENEALRARVAEIGAMAGGLAHEIKNPLSTIGMNAQLLDESIAELDADPQSTARIRRRIGILTRETERLRGILEDFLDYAGELRLHRVHTPLAPVLEELADFFHPEADKRGIRLRVETPAGQIGAYADIPHLKQAILNLMINASQAMGTEPAESAQPAPRELIIRLDLAPAGRPRIQIIDTGPGIEAERAARIFEPYFTTKAGGTGLGLPTTRRIIEAHGGTLTLDTEPGRGSAFAITLPSASEHGHHDTPVAD